MFNGSNTVWKRVALFVLIIFIMSIFSIPEINNVISVKAAYPNAPSSPKNNVVKVSATIYRNPDQIKLKVEPSEALTFPKNSKYQDYKYDIYRTEGESRVWKKIASGLTGYEYTDSDVKVGMAYEYRVEQMFFLETDKSPIMWRTGFVYTGIDVPTTDVRGKIVLVVDKTYSNILANEINQLVIDLTGDGWQVLRHDVARSEIGGPTYAKDIIAVKNLIKKDYTADPINVKGVFLLGNVPVPYSGLYICPDGHPNHAGAWVADNYYGDMDGKWADTGKNNPSQEYLFTRNEPGDGKFDQDVLPSSLELFVGRVDFANLNVFTKKNDVELMRQYLNKDHNYRSNKMAVSKGAYIHDKFQNYAYGAEFAWSNFTSILGTNAITYNDKDEPHAFPIAAQNENYEWYYGGASGHDSGVDDIFTAEDCAKYDPKAKFYMLFGSYFGDWNSSDNVLRAALGTSTGLMSVWGSRPGWYFQRSVLDRPLGYSQLDTLEFNQVNSMYKLIGDNNVVAPYVNMLGDPTLRLQNVTPISNLTLAVKGTQCDVSWTPSNDTGIQGYNIYRATSSSGSYVKLNKDLVTQLNYTDANIVLGKTYYYMVRAQKLVTNEMRSFYSYSVGVFNSTDGKFPLPVSPNIKTVTDKSTAISGTSVPNGLVTLKVGTKSYKINVPVGGKWTFKLSKKLSVGTKLAASVVLDGKSSLTKILFVKPTAPKVNKITSKAKNITGKTYKNATVKISINNSWKTLRTNKKGLFSLKLKKAVKKGSYVYVTVKYKSQASDVVKCKIK